MDKVIDIEERIPKLRDRRQKRKNRKFAGLLIFFLLLLALLVYSQTPYSKIQNIRVEGDSLVTESAYIRASGLEKGQAIWLFGTAPVEESLEKMSWVEEVTVRKNWPTTVDIDVTEYEPVGFLENTSGYQVLLSNGYADAVRETELDGPLISGFEKEEERAGIAAQLTALEPEVYRLISEIIQPEPKKQPEKVVLYMNDGNEVRASMDTLAEKLKYYPSITAQLEKGQKGILDVEVGIYFRPYEGTYSEDIKLEEEPSGQPAGGTVTDEAATEESAGDGPAAEEPSDGENESEEGGADEEESEPEAE